MTKDDMSGERTGGTAIVETIGGGWRAHGI
jgi:hypothetical protein